MTKKSIPVNQVKEDIAKMFDLFGKEKNGSSFSSKENDSFRIHYTLLPAPDVLNKLNEYFADKYIKNGHIMYKGSSLGWVSFDILEGAPNQN